MTGTLDSLNIATAAGIAMHRLHEVRKAERPKFEV
jgi:tRNA G18 (ribose-2'-O)-methylase SpoU